ncbi:hypothetical protein Desor_3238 [Desulfosporosinus orientis DSM 765]|uniref:Uncharacterized protein n=1 Tax=Desulfosporosinus orientis (strain ATCC 19365 / DSM 765 / NCIMB 8382 / VKM B-1628 / Singapore I) TaxID=768706 RepID=G7W9A1_DESOD|nr:hypothetical protein [Desulfosporosinus orientis]AET68742.1 hypothetical protein Desor_3238 [Desulfosporosinus orientis DSM 765]
MTNNNFNPKIKDCCFEDSTIKLDEMKKILADIMPVEGYVDSEIFEEDGAMNFVLKDYYNEDKRDVADFLCQLTINSEGIIQVVKHDIPQFINYKNQKIMLFFSSLVGKKLNYKVKDDDIIDPRW